MMNDILLGSWFDLTKLDKIQPDDEPRMIDDVKPDEHCKQVLEDILRILDENDSRERAQEPAPHVAKSSLARSVDSDEASDMPR
jgi:hypothetical protein